MYTTARGKFIDALAGIRRSPLERTVERRFTRLVARHGGITIKLYRRDWPDRLVLLPGNAHFFCELKRPGTRPRPGQRRAHAMLRGLGHGVCIVDGTDWPAAVRYVQGHLRA